LYLKQEGKNTFRTKFLEEGCFLHLNVLKIDLDDCDVQDSGFE
jgi:hypothetical protein